MTEKERRVFQFSPEIRADGERKKITGYAVKWEQLSQPIYGVFREKFLRGAFTQTLIDRANDIFATWQHDMRDTLGRTPATLSIREDETGLWYEIDPPTWAIRYIESIERGDVRGSSFTFVPTVIQHDYDSDPEFVIRSVVKADLYEVAPVTLPAYPQSSASVRSEKDIAAFILSEKARRERANRDYLERCKALRDLSLKV